MNQILAKRLLGAGVLVAVTLLLANLLPAPQSMPPPEAAAKRITYDLRQPKIDIPPEQVQATLQAIDPRQVVAQMAPPPAAPNTTRIPLDDPRLAHERAAASPPVVRAPVAPRVTPAPKPRPPASPKPPPKAVAAAPAPSPTPPPDGNPAEAKKAASPAVAPPSTQPPTAEAVASKNPEPLPSPSPAKSEPPAPPPAEPAAAKEQSSPQAVVPAPDAVTAKPMAAPAWYVQIGAFAKEANAEHSVRKLKQAGIVAKLDTVAFKAGPRYRVRCGPLTSSEEA